MKIKSVIIASCLAFVAASCSTGRSNLPYFEDIDSSYDVSVNTTNYSPKINVDDELSIMVTSLSPLASSQYNLTLSIEATRSDNLYLSTTPRMQTYIVSSKGTIDMPVIGTITVAGMTVEELKDKIVKIVEKDVESPTVIVKMINFHVNVAGEVHKPGTQVVGTQRYSVLDALTAAGDLTEYGERTNVLIIREENGKRTAHRLDLTSSDVLTSPYFYLQQNDYVYVTPNKIRQDNSKYNQNNAFKLSVTSTIVSGCSVIASLIIALAID
jgi:polysaccharide export outer membrane protein